MEDWLAAQRVARPDGLALTFEGKAWTYMQLDGAVQDCCRRLSSLGLPTGEVVAVHLANSPVYVFLVHAFARLGWVLAPLNVRLTPVELSRQLGHLDVHYLISESLDAQEAAFAAQEHIRVLSLDSLQALPPQDFTPLPLDLERTQAIVFTSGTSGHAKGAVLTFGAHFWSALGSAARLGILPQDRWLSVLPLYHVGGLSVVFRSCLYGTGISLHAGFNLEAVAASLSAEPITLISLVPTLLRRMLAAGVRFPASLRCVLLGGAGSPPDLLQACWEQGLSVAVTYGLTEAASQVATLVPDEAHLKPGCVGKPLLFTRVWVEDEAGNALPPGEVGEICVTGPTLMRGYWRDEPATRLTLRGGVLHTGDLGYLDSDGDLWVLQRRRDLIISGGENIYPAEVEAALRQHPAIADACVVGLPDHEWGQRVAAAVVLQPGAHLTEAKLVAFARQHLAGYKQPRRILFLPALPQTASGKVIRDEVTLLFGASEK